VKKIQISAPILRKLKKLLFSEPVLIDLIGQGLLELTIALSHGVEAIDMLVLEAALNVDRLFELSDRDTLAVIALRDIHEHLKVDLGHRRVSI